MKKFTDAEIKEVQEARGTSRKMAIQWLKRNAGKAAAPAKASRPGKADMKTYPVDGPDGKEVRVTIPEDEPKAATSIQWVEAGNENIKTVPELAASAPESKPEATAPEAKPKAAAPAKPKHKAGEITEKRAAILASPEFKAAHEAGLAKRKKGPMCKNGHDLRDAANVHVGDLMRTGLVTCNECWKKQNAAYLARTAS